MRKKFIITLAIFMVLFASLSYANFERYTVPNYVQDAMRSVASKMSYSLGLSKCEVVNQNKDLWVINCMPNKGGAELVFSVFPSQEAPYDVSTTFYLVAENEEARNNSDKGLLYLLAINTSAKSH